MKVFLQEKLGLETYELSPIERAHRIGKKEDLHSKVFKLQAARESVTQIQGTEIMGGSNLYKPRLQ